MIVHVLIVGVIVVSSLVVARLGYQWYQNKQSVTTCPMVEAEDHCCLSDNDNLESAESIPDLAIVLSQKDSLEEHISFLTEKLAAKEGKMQVSKSKILETQDEMQNLLALDQEIVKRYNEIIDSLKHDLKSNEKDCTSLQRQIEWLSRRRTELRDEVMAGQSMYCEAVTGLAKGLQSIQREARPMTKSPLIKSSMMRSEDEECNRDICGLRSDPKPACHLRKISRSGY